MLKQSEGIGRDENLFNSRRAFRQEGTKELERAEAGGSLGRKSFPERRKGASRGQESGLEGLGGGKEKPYQIGKKGGLSC